MEGFEDALLEEREALSLLLGGLDTVGHAKGGEGIQDLDHDRCHGLLVFPPRLLRSDPIRILSRKKVISASERAVVAIASKPCAPWPRSP